MTFRTSTVESTAGCWSVRAAILAACFAIPCCFAAEPGMVFVPAGDFLRGRSHPLKDENLKWYPTLMKDDKPVKRIYVSAYYLDQHEVTNDQYFAFVKATGHRPPYNWSQGRFPEKQGTLPVVDVSWEDATAYAKWAGKRLPTEAEWERACRGLADGKTYPWGDRAPTAKDARFNVGDGPGEVCKTTPNYFGLCDIAGNVWEWCSDWYEKDYYARSPDRDPPGPDQGLYRVLRGGSWADIQKYLTCSYRSWARPAERSPNIGFRCAKSFSK